MLSAVFLVCHQPYRSSNTAVPLLSFVSDSSFCCFGDSQFDLGTLWSLWQMSLWWVQGIFCSHQRSSWTFWDLLPGKVFHLLRFKQWLSACFPALQDTQAQKKPFSKVMGSSAIGWNTKEETSLLGEPWSPLLGYIYWVIWLYILLMPLLEPECKITQ